MEDIIANFVDEDYPLPSKEEVDEITNLTRKKIEQIVLGLCNFYLYFDIFYIFSLFFSLKKEQKVLDL